MSAFSACFCFIFSLYFSIIFLLVSTDGQPARYSHSRNGVGSRLPQASSSAPFSSSSASSTISSSSSKGGGSNPSSTLGSGGSRRAGTCDDYAEIVDEEGDYSAPGGRDYEIERAAVELGEIIGEGQFGDVHKGEYHQRPAEEGVPVAVKTCKVDGDAAMTEKFLEEACK